MLEGMTFFWSVLRWASILFIGFLVFVMTVLRVVKRLYPVPAPEFFTRVIDNPIRRRFVQRPEVVADRVGLRPGMVVVEIGPGKGSYTVAMAERVAPGGRVYAIDIQEEVVERLMRRAERDGITNLYPSVDDAYDLSFEDGSVDRVVAIACLPEIPEPVRALREFHRILKPEGLVCLSELLPDPDYPRRGTEKRWADEAGFELSEEFGNWFVYQLNFRKKRPDRPLTGGKPAPANSLPFPES
jgi:SAM-dependent methyltransferase